MSNNAPECLWYRYKMSNDVVRRRLYVNGSETIYFIDTAARSYQRTYGQKHGLYGSGLHPQGSAGIVGYGPRLDELKARAEQRALAALEANPSATADSR